MLHLLKFAQTDVKTREDIYDEFITIINMSPLDLEKGLEAKPVKSVSAAAGKSPELIIDKKLSGKLIKILRKRKYMLTKGDYEFMEKITSLIDKLYGQKPAENLLDSDWRYTLMNLGHDPLKVLKN